MAGTRMKPARRWPNRLTAGLAVFAALLCLPATGVSGLPGQDSPQPLLCDSFELVQEHRLGPGQPLFGHVQGLEVNEQYFFVTAVTSDEATGFLYLYPRQGAEGRLPALQYDLGQIARELGQSCGRLDSARLNHPSGIHLAGDRLHVVIAPSANRGPSCVMTLDLANPPHPQMVRAVRIDDHVGAVLQLADGSLLSFNWGSDDAWRLEKDGEARRLPMQEELAGLPQERLHLQDCDRKGNLVLCTHNDNRRDNLVKVYRAAALATPGTPLKPQTIVIPPLGSKHGGTHEGLAWDGDRLFLLPDDGDRDGVTVYELRCVASP